MTSLIEPSIYVPAASPAALHAAGEANGAATIQVRRFPYPYRAMLAICSDLDGTRDHQMYGEIMRLLNSTERTRMGAGVGLEVANSIYFDMPPSQFAYWNTDERGREMVRALMRSGHIDCIHSFGKLATTREHARRALEELARHDCALKVWVDHGTAPSNFGADVMRGYGDVPGHAVYHADLTYEFGVRYVWRGRVTSVIGQDCPGSVRGLFNPGHRFLSARTITKELLKRMLARLGSRKYVLHGTNDLLQRSQLRDGHQVYEFLRCDPYWGGVSEGATADGLAHALSADVLDRLVQRAGSCILYTHLGKIREPSAGFGEPTHLALQRLADQERAGRILVTTTSRLLSYRRALDEISLCTRTDAAGTHIDIRTTHERNGGAALAPADLHGLTIYVPQPQHTRLSIDGVPVPTVQHNSADHLGRSSVMLPWPRLEFPHL